MLGLYLTINEIPLRYSASILAFLLAPLFSVAVKAETIYVEPKFETGIIRFVFLNIDDQVNGNCWTSSRAVAAEIRLALEREGIGVLEEKPAFYSPAVYFLELRALGLRTNQGSCVAHSRVYIGRPAKVVWGKDDLSPTEFHFSSYTEIWSTDAVFFAGSNNNQQIGELARTAVTEFLADHLAAKRSSVVEDFFDKNPRLLMEPMSANAFKELMEKDN